MPRSPTPLLLATGATWRAYVPPLGAMPSLVAATLVEGRTRPGGFARADPRSTPR